MVPIDPFNPPPVFNLAAYVLSAGEVTPDKDALVLLSPAAETTTVSYRTLRTQVQTIASALLARGLRPQDQVLMRLANDVTFPLVYLGCLWAGCVPIITSAQLTQAEVTRCAASVAPKAIVDSPGIVRPDMDLPVFSADDLLQPSDTQSPAHLGDPDRLGYIVFTSGSSGRPKPVAHAHRAILARRLMWDGWYGLRPTERLLHAGAFNWTYTLGTGLMDPWAIGATALIPAAGTQPSDLPNMLAQAKATLFAAAPGVYRQMLRTPFPPLPHLRHGLSAGEALPEVTRTAWQHSTGTEIYEALGMSECSTYVSGSPSCPAPQGSAGFPQEGRRIAVLDDHGTAADQGTLAIHRSDPGLMLGYWDNGAPYLPQQDGWFHTGDQVSQDTTGALTYLGRSDDMMNAGGFRLSPLELEAALRPCPEIGEIAVTEVRPTAEKSLIAAFTTGPAQEPALRAFATANLAAYKRPHLWVHLDTLPKTATGKINRRALRDGDAWHQALR